MDTLFVQSFIGFSNLQLTDYSVNHFIERYKDPVIPIYHSWHSVLRSLEDIYREAHNPAPESEYICNHILAALLAQICREIHHQYKPFPKDSRSSAAVEAAKGYIAENYSKSVSLKTISDFTHISPYHLSHLFSKETGISPIRYLNMYRINTAKQYLSTTDYMVPQVAQLVGYECYLFSEYVQKECRYDTRTVSLQTSAQKVNCP